MIYALDTSVVSALRRSHPDDRAVTAWAASVPMDSVYLPAFVLTEIRAGVDSLRRRDPAQAEILDGWLDFLVATYDGRILDFTFDAAMLAGHMLARPDAPGVMDSLIAATARAHGATVVTRNGKDFSRTGVTWVNPWAADAG
ncbi:type II toxin-antitoxin system VapC family toxin [uncultured Demequina sp.]|mgnify:FL=1|uniref:type II toxin-antitoxin system VapC family toxin n=1 Tax=uncultured Demequina sp. TaxID=693499 RepID=UPI0025D06527|nr:type II toxin-antitoxin system VapC family toxin [uncultured Demequina sp.]